MSEVIYPEEVEKAVRVGARLIAHRLNTPTEEAAQYYYEQIKANMDKPTFSQPIKAEAKSELPKTLFGFPVEEVDLGPTYNPNPIVFGMLPREGG